MSIKLKFNGLGSGTKDDPFELPFNTRDGVDFIDGEFVMEANHGDVDIDLFSLGFSNNKVSVLLEDMKSSNGIYVTVPVQFRAIEWFPNVIDRVFIRATKFGHRHESGTLENSLTLLDTEHTHPDGWSGSDYWFVTVGNPPTIVDDGPCEVDLEIPYEQAEFVRRLSGVHVIPVITTANGTGDTFINYGSVSDGLEVRQNGDTYSLRLTRVGKQSVTFSGFVRWMVKDGLTGMPFTDVRVPEVVLEFDVVPEDYEPPVKSTSGNLTLADVKEETSAGMTTHEAGTLAGLFQPISWPRLDDIESSIDELTKKIDQILEKLK